MRIYLSRSIEYDVNYEILAESSAKRLEFDIKSYECRGWRPVGQMWLAVSDNRPLYMQTMVKAGASIVPPSCGTIQ
jgi:hypothetical protein